MAFSPYIIGILLFIGLFTLFLRRGELRGKIGESLVSNKLDRLPKDKYRVLNNVTIPTPKGSSQIDHLVISIFGIFVIETKNLKGWVYGGEQSEYWTQNIYGKKYQLYNPILQNAGHIRALRRILKEYEPLPFFSIVAFSGRADLKVKIEDACVVYMGQILSVIRQFEASRLTWGQVNSIYGAVISAQIEPSRENSRQHKEDIYNARVQKNEAFTSGRCPRCGGKLVLRSGKYGKFYGCSSYPKCRYTHPY
ncbi:MAG: NERD domain-containing protein [Bacteroidales bacterium]|nr:NERD domain-containing protein [Bacteroidales bacterium]